MLALLNHFDDRIIANGKPNDCADRPPLLVRRLHGQFGDPARRIPWRVRADLDIERARWLAEDEALSQRLSAATPDGRDKHAVRTVRKIKSHSLDLAIRLVNRLPGEDILSLTQCDGKGRAGRFHFEGDTFASAISVARGGYHSAAFLGLRQRKLGVDPVGLGDLEPVDGVGFGCQPESPAPLVFTAEFGNRLVAVVDNHAG